MASIITIHSFRRGTGKSMLTANLAVLLAAQGHRIGVIDANLQAPGLHTLFGINELGRQPTLNDYLAGRCEAGMATLDLSAHYSGAAGGALFLMPSSGSAEQIAATMRGGHSSEALSEAYTSLIDELHLDLLLVDNAAGLNEETLLTIAVSDTLLLLLRPDRQHYQGTSLTLDLARRLGVARLFLLVNEVPAGFQPAAVAAQVAQSFGAPVVAALPHSKDLEVVASGDLLVLRYPHSPIAAALRELADALI